MTDEVIVPGEAAVVANLKEASQKLAEAKTFDELFAAFVDMAPVMEAFYTEPAEKEGDDD